MLRTRSSGETEQKKGAAPPELRDYLFSILMLRLFFSDEASLSAKDKSRRDGISVTQATKRIRRVPEGRHIVVIGDKRVYK